MSAGTLAMLVGLFVLPTYLLWAGHHWRKRSARVRGAFWGGVIGHTTAALIATATALYSPIHWSAADKVRGFMGLWLMLALGLLGMAVGAWLGAREERK